MSAKSEQMQRLLDQLATAENHVMQTAEAIRELVTKEAKQYPPEPMGTGNVRLTVSVQFTENGRVYEYLVLRTNGRWYITGLKDSSFASWEEFIDWLERPDVYWHGSLSRLSRVSTPVLDEYLRPL